MFFVGGNSAFDGAVEFFELGIDEFGGDFFVDVVDSAFVDFVSFDGFLF